MRDLSGRRLRASLPTLTALLLVCYEIVEGGTWRDDLRCGAPYLASDGVSIATCNPNSVAPCCSEYQWCGGSKEHCLCDTCYDHRSRPWRNDGRCGYTYPGDDGTLIGECNPTSSTPCCQNSICVPSLECAIKPAYRNVDYSANYRFDMLCGPKYPAPDGSGVGQCIGDGPNPCCGDQGVCSRQSDEFCNCEQCVDYSMFDEELLSCGGYTWYLDHDKFLHRVGVGCKVGVDKCYSCDTINFSSKDIRGLMPGVFSFISTYFLSVASNYIRELPDKLFDESDIAIISFSNNNIMNLQPGVMEGLIAPQNLDLSENEIIGISKEALHGLSELKHFRLNNNNITNISVALFSNLPQLQSLYLHNNDITLVARHGFFGLESMQMLDLSGQKSIPECCSILFAVEDLMQTNKEGLHFDQTCLWSDKGITPQQIIDVTLDRMFVDIPHHLEQENKSTIITILVEELLGVRFLDLFPQCAYCSLHSTYKVDNVLFLDVPLQNCTEKNDVCTAIAGHTLKCPPVHQPVSEDSTSTCTEVGNNFECGCAHGYEHTDGNCTDIDECAIGTHACAEAICHNVPGTYECICDKHMYLVGDNTCLPCTIYDPRCIICNVKTCLECEAMFLPDQNGACLEVFYQDDARPYDGVNTAVNPGITAAVIVTTVLFVSALLVLLFLCLYRKKRKNYERQLMEIKKRAHWVEGDTDEAHLLFEAVQTIDGWIDRQHFVSLEKIGSGNFGDVFRGVIFHNKLATMCAIKRMRSSGIEEDTQEFLNEAQLLRSLSHPNICKMLAVCDHEGSLYLLMEYCEEGDLHNYMIKNPQNMTTTAMCWFAKEIAKGMAYLSTIQVVHRDIAARNILLSHVGHKLSQSVLNTSHLPKPKISDFGLARRTTSEHSYVKQSHDGVLPIRWMARETILTRVYTEKSDVWSFGVTLWEIFTLGQVPYSDFKSHELVVCMAQSRIRLPRPTDCPDEMFDLMRLCWEEEPAERPSFESMILPLDAMFRASKTPSSSSSAKNYASAAPVGHASSDPSTTKSTSAMFLGIAWLDKIYRTLFKSADKLNESRLFNSTATTSCNSTEGGESDGFGGIEMGGLRGKSQSLTHTGTSVSNTHSLSSSIGSPSWITVNVGPGRGTLSTLGLNKGLGTNVKKNFNTNNPEINRNMRALSMASPLVQHTPSLSPNVRDDIMRTRTAPPITSRSPAHSHQEPLDGATHIPRRLRSVSIPLHTSSPLGELQEHAHQTHTQLRSFQSPTDRNASQRVAPTTNTTNDIAQILPLSHQQGLKQTVDDYTMKTNMGTPRSDSMINTLYVQYQTMPSLTSLPTDTDHYIDLTTRHDGSPTLTPTSSHLSAQSQVSHEEMNSRNPFYEHAYTETVIHPNDLNTCLRDYTDDTKSE
eukprot:CFRG2751T1